MFTRGCSSKQYSQRLLASCHHGASYSNRSFLLNGRWKSYTGTRLVVSDSCGKFPVCRRCSWVGARVAHQQNVLRSSRRLIVLRCRKRLLICTGLNRRFWARKSTHPWMELHKALRRSWLWCLRDISWKYLFLKISRLDQQACGDRRSQIYLLTGERKSQDSRKPFMKGRLSREMGVIWSNVLHNLSIHNVSKQLRRKGEFGCFAVLAAPWKQFVEPHNSCQKIAQSCTVMQCRQGPSFPLWRLGL